MTAPVTVQSLERRLARSGHRVTAPRRTLLGAMQQLGDHFTAEQLASAAPEVGRATVFRTLRLLLEIGSLCHVPLDDGNAEYRLTEGGHHHHVVCNHCGRVNDVADCDLSEIVRQVALSTGFNIEGHRLELYGRCQTCQQDLGAA